MQQVLNGLDFQIILKSEELKESSIQWKKDCKVLYNLIRKNLPEGSVNPLNRRCEDGERAGLVPSYDTLALAGITLQSFIVIIKLIDVWERNKKKANVEFRSKNGNKISIFNLPSEEALEIFKSLQHDDNK